MKRRVLSFVAVMATVICLCAAPSFAADNMKIGVGYQGIIAGNMLNGLSVRGWVGPNTAIGVEGNVFYGSAEVDTPGTDQKANLWLIEAKAMYAFIVRQNSRFFAGGKFGYGQFKTDPADLKGTLYIPGIFVGAEWNFPALPEVGFNFEVGYNYVLNKNKINDDDVDLKLHGINVGAGIKYYF